MFIIILTNFGNIANLHSMVSQNRKLQIHAKTGDNESLTANKRSSIESVDKENLYKVQFYNEHNSVHLKMRFLIVAVFLLLYFGITIASSEVGKIDLYFNENIKNTSLFVTDSIHRKIADLKKCCKSKIIKNERSHRSKKISSDCLEEDYGKLSI